ncbi:hypothetical protein IC63_00210 [Paracoccus sphaerophysae]|uniref:Uncharacterized protein n=1 Tax=Paracoccus sphaerophysae TaxID=690417 RepID=A0A099FHF3_9RHOB|nr:hypothetical protein IC63_00210 [Paracoccus sphaerophysae]
MSRELWVQQILGRSLRRRARSTPRIPAVELSGAVGDAEEADAQPELQARMQRIAADHDDLSAQ